MSFQAFFQLFPKIASDETRSVTLLEPQYGLPAGKYAFAEQFCNDPGCDCRRVIFGVFQKGRRDPIAHIGWGWEPRDFYAKWMYWETDTLMIDQCKGPALNPTSPQSELADGSLALCREILLQDALYVERVKRHYRLFRERIDGGYVPHGLSQSFGVGERKRRDNAKAAKKAQKAARKRNRR